jgi:hypothetical protein
MVLNVYGLISSFEVDSKSVKAHSLFKDDRVVSYTEFLTTYAHEPGESRGEYVTRLTMLVHARIAHLWMVPWSRVPASENFILYLLGFLSDKFGEYEFFDWHKAVERAVGSCSQHASVLVGILEEQGIAANMVLLNGHVVASAEVAPDSWWILDADLGRLIQAPLAEVERNPQLVEQAYSDVARNCIREKHECPTIEDLVRVFTTEDNEQIGPGLFKYSWKWYVIEKLAYLLKWILPTVLMLLGGYRLLDPSHSRRTATGGL